MRAARRRAVVAVGDVERRQRLERGGEAGYGVRIGHRPHLVPHLVVRGDVDGRCDTGDRGDKSIEAGRARVGEHRRTGPGAPTASI